MFSSNCPSKSHLSKQTGRDCCHEPHWAWAPKGEGPSFTEISTPCVWTEACHIVDDTGLCEDNDKTINFIDQTSLSLYLFKWPSVGFTIMVYLIFTAMWILICRRYFKEVFACKARRESKFHFWHPRTENQQHWTQLVECLGHQQDTLFFCFSRKFVMCQKKTYNTHMQLYYVQLHNDQSISLIVYI